MGNDKNKEPLFAQQLNSYEDIEYAKAINAHAQEKAICIEGDLHLQGRSSELKNARNLIVLDQED